MAEKVSSGKRKGVTAAGPLPILTGFPIKPEQGTLISTDTTVWFLSQHFFSWIILPAGGDILVLDGRIAAEPAVLILTDHPVRGVSGNRLYENDG